MKFQSAFDIEHAADEISKFLREADSSYIRISFFSDTKEIENLKKSISSVEIGMLSKPFTGGISDDRWDMSGGKTSCRV